MNDLTPAFERETGQVTLEALPAGAAGEASLAPVPGVDLAFDRVDGRLCRVVVDITEAGGPAALGEQAAVMLTRLLGSEALAVILGATMPGGEDASARCVLRPEPELAGALSSLARVYAAQATSPAPAGSSWWAAEAAQFAKRAGLAGTAPAEPRLAIWPRSPALDVGAEVERLEKERTRLAGPQWMLDPGLLPAGLFQFGLSPYSDLVVWHEDGGLVVEARLAPGADCGAFSDCWARLVDPVARRTLVQARFAAVAGSRARARLTLPFALDGLAESWVEAVGDKRRPVRSARGHWTRRALRWADVALRAERAPAALDPEATRHDWSALAAGAWGRCRHDWAAAGDEDRAYLAARRQAVADPTTCVPRVPSAQAAEIAGQVPLGGPAYLAEAMSD